MLKIALCDDHPETLFRLEKDMAEFRAQNGANLDIQVRSYSNGLDLLADIGRGEQFHIYLLDVMMPLMDGMEAARDIRQRDKSAKIIFLTSSPAFALDAYDVKAFFYLLKNSPREKLFSVLNDAVSEIENVLGNYTLVKTKTGLVKLLFGSVEYIEIIGKTIFFHISNGDQYEMYGTLKEIEDAFLPQARFIKPHRSYIVNMDYMRRLHENGIITMSGCYVPVSKANYNDVKTRYISYSFGRGEKHD